MKISFIFSLIIIIISIMYLLFKRKNSLKTNIAVGFILDKNYDLIAYIPSLCDYSDGKLIIHDLYSTKYYETKIYSAKEIIEQAKTYLEERGR